MRHSYVVIEGNIGSGKTSLVEMLSYKYGGRSVLEGFADNPFLPKFYEEPERYAFAVEMSFLSDRYHQLNRELRQQSLFNKNTFSDYSLSKSLIFASSNLEQEEFDLFQKMYQVMMSNLPKPDLLVYLHRDVSELQKNIQKRGREYERNISDDYLHKIQESYFQFLKQQDLKMLIIDLNTLDFLEEDSVFDNICHLIDSQYDTGIQKVIL